MPGLVPGIDALLAKSKTWMAGTSPAMTNSNSECVMNVEVKPSVISYKLLIEKDVDVPMRDGARLKADVFRPDDGGKFPAILNLGPYQKDKLWVPSPQLAEK